MSSPITLGVTGGLLVAMAGLVAGDYFASRALMCLGLVALACSLLAASRALGRARAQALGSRRSLTDSLPDSQPARH